MELTFLPGFRADPKWIAATLGIAPLESKLALDRLKTLGLIVEQDGRWIKATKDMLRTPPGKTTSMSLRRHQVEILQKGAEAVDRLPVEARVNASMTFPMAKERLEAARTMIEQFTLALCRAMTSDTYDSVFQLGICFYPLTKDRRTAK